MLLFIARQLKERLCPISALTRQIINTKLPDSLQSVGYTVSIICNAIIITTGDLKLVLFAHEIFPITNFLQIILIKIQLLVCIHYKYMRVRTHPRLGASLWIILMIRDQFSMANCSKSAAHMVDFQKTFAHLV